MRRVQVAVVGGGPAGYFAALTAAQYGAQTVLLDEALAPGGALQDWEGDDRGFDFCRRHVVWGLFADNVLGVTSDSESYQLQAQQVILATGSTDQPCPFPGGSLPGVLTGRALYVLTHSMGVMPGRRFVVIGDGNDAIDAGITIERFGGEIVARVATNQVQTFRAMGEYGIEAVEVEGTRIEAETVVVAVGRQPDFELALMAECAIGFNQDLGGFVPVLNEYLRTSKRTILAVGDAAGICDQASAEAEGTFAGASASHELGLVDDSELARARASYVERAAKRVNQMNAVQPSYAQV